MSTIILPIENIEVTNKYIKGYFEHPKEWENAYIRITYLKVISPLKDISIHMNNKYYSPEIILYQIALDKMKKTFIDVTNPIVVYDHTLCIRFEIENIDIDDHKMLINESICQITWDYFPENYLVYQFIFMEKINDTNPIVVFMEKKYISFHCLLFH